MSAEKTLNVSKQGKYSMAGIMKFAFFSVIGVFLFLVPVPYQKSFNIPVGILIDLVKNILKDSLLFIATGLIVGNALISCYVSIFKPKKFISENFKALFVASPLYLGSRIIGGIFAIMVFFNIGPAFIISKATGGTMLDLCKTLIAIGVVVSYLMPLLTDFGVMEFTGVLIRGLVKPLFTCPGRSAVDLITSWLGAAPAAVLLTKKQYDTGYYSAREAAVIMTNFSLVSVPFCYIVASILKIEEMFVPFYLITTAVGFVLAMIMPRIAPLSRIKDEYNPETGKLVNEELPKDQKKFDFALSQAVERAKRQDFKAVINEGNKMFLSIMTSLLPIVLAWGTLALIVVEYTKVFSYIAYPMAYYLNILGIDEAFKVAPATLVGFVDMFIPALMLAASTSVKTKFIIGALSLVQIIYITEVGTIIIQSKVPLNFKHLLILFLERTVIALPLLTLAYNLIY